MLEKLQWLLSEKNVDKMLSYGHLQFSSAIYKSFAGTMNDDVVLICCFRYVGLSEFP